MDERQGLRLWKHSSIIHLQIVRTFRIETRKASKAVARRKVRFYLIGGGEVTLGLTLRRWEAPFC